MTIKVNKIVVIFTFLLSFMLCLSSVCASDIDNHTMDIVNPDDSYEISSINLDSGDATLNDNLNNSYEIVNTDDDYMVYEGADIDKENAGTFTDLNEEIQKLRFGDTFVFERDYYFNSTFDSDFINGININIPGITLNGDGHRIDGSNLAAIFNVNADNVGIYNFVITNSNAIRDYKNLETVSINDFNNVQAFSKFILVESNYKISPITWLADYGTISNCLFADNTAVNGGAVSWSGNKGRIKNTLFLNNTATGIGGAIYFGGVDNIIENSTFFNSVSLLSGESIYMERRIDNGQVNNCTFYNCAIAIIDGFYTDIDVDIFYKNPVYTKVMDDEFDLISTIYSTLMNNANNITDFKDSIYTFEFNGTDFLFTQYNILKFNESSSKYAIKGISLKEVCTEKLYEIVFAKEFHFSNVKVWNDIFNAVFMNNFTVNYNLIQNCEFEGEDAYGAATGVTNRLNDYLKYTKDGEYVTKVMKISIKSTRNIVQDRYSWDIGKLDCDVVTINGNGLTVQGRDDCSKEDKWAKIDKDCVFAPSNFIIEKFNHGIYNNGGTCIVNNMTFNKNYINYMIDPTDWGAGIANAGVLICNNCTFTNNTAQNGGAIFNQGLAYIDNCTFLNNKAYDHGNDVLNVDKGAVIVDGKMITDSSEGIVDYKKSMPSVDAMWYVVGAIGLASLSAFAVGYAIGAVAGVAAGVSAGIIAGVGFGVCFGGAAYFLIASKTFDINYNRFKLALICICSASVAGVLAGVTGGVMGGMVYSSSSALTGGAATEGVAGKQINSQLNNNEPLIKIEENPNPNPNNEPLIKIEENPNPNTEPLISNEEKPNVGQSYNTGIRNDMSSIIEYDHESNLELPNIRESTNNMRISGSSDVSEVNNIIRESTNNMRISSDSDLYFQSAYRNELEFSEVINPNVPFNGEPGAEIPQYAYENPANVKLPKVQNGLGDLNIVIDEFQAEGNHMRGTIAPCINNGVDIEGANLARSYNNFKVPKVPTYN